MVREVVFKIVVFHEIRIAFYLKEANYIGGMLPHIIPNPAQFMFFESIFYMTTGFDIHHPQKKKRYKKRTPSKTTRRWHFYQLLLIE